MSAEPRYIVGIDLGTTNCALAFVDTLVDDARIEPFAIPQVVGPGEVEPRPTLPSFLLLPGPHDVAEGALTLPWSDSADHAVGTFARDRGSELPTRLVSSAKSWLGNPEVDLTEPILPWRSKAAAADDDDDGARVSPVEASARYLGHLRAAWDQRFPEHTLAAQEVYLTVPASFDAVARELTVLAAKHAGLSNITLLEEPQAAFYSWLGANPDQWRAQLSPGDVVLVCDIGGGTTDFSIIAVSDDGSGGLELERVAVGDHILLGGDNMDLALSYTVAARLAEQKNKKLKPRQQAALTHACRAAKEKLLADLELAAVPVTILGGGSKLIGGSIKTEVTRADIDNVIAAGFFPECSADATPKQRARMGLGELGLDYAADAAMTRHLASFLARHDKQPTAILFNGGVMQSPLLRERVSSIVSGWFDGKAAVALSGTDLDLAVAHGAAYYGLAKRGRGVRIRGGTARSYYIGVETAMPAIPGFEPPVKAMCVVPFGLEEGTEVDLPREEFGLVVGHATDFRFFASTVRTDDTPGELVDADDDLVELAPVRTELSTGAGHDAGDRVPVTLAGNVTEVGTLELFAVARDGSGKWKLEYSIRGQDDQ